MMHSDLLIREGVNPEEKDWSHSPWVGVAVCPDGEIIQHDMTGEIWRIDYSQAKGDGHSFEDAPVYPAGVGDIRAMKKRHKEMLLDDGKHEVAKLFGYL